MIAFDDGLQLAQESGKYGAGLMRDMRRYYGSFVGIAQRGEMLPNSNTFCELDPKVRDRWGLPVLRFTGDGATPSSSKSSMLGRRPWT